MSTKKMCSLVIRMRKCDKENERPLWELVLEAMTKYGIGGASVWQGIGGYGKRGASTFQKYGLTYDAPVMIETVDEREKIEHVAKEIKKLIGGNGLITLQEAEVV